MSLLTFYLSFKFKSVSPNCSTIAACNVVFLFKNLNLAIWKLGYHCTALCYCSKSTLALHLQLLFHLCIEWIYLSCFVLQCLCAGWSCLHWGPEDMNVPVKCHICVMATQLCYWMILSTSGVGVMTQRGPAMCFMPLMSVSRPASNSHC